MSIHAYVINTIDTNANNICNSIVIHTKSDTHTYITKTLTYIYIYLYIYIYIYIYMMIHVDHYVYLHY